MVTFQFCVLSSLVLRSISRPPIYHCTTAHFWLYFSIPSNKADKGLYKQFKVRTLTTSLCHYFLCLAKMTVLLHLLSFYGLVFLFIVILCLSFRILLFVCFVSLLSHLVSFCLKNFKLFSFFSFTSFKAL